MKRKAPALYRDRPGAPDGFGCDYPVKLIHGCAHALCVPGHGTGLQQPLQATRRYRPDYTEADHVELLELGLPCQVMVSGRPSALYDDLLRDWRPHRRTAGTPGAACRRNRLPGRRQDPIAPCRHRRDVQVPASQARQAGDRGDRHQLHRHAGPRLLGRMAGLRSMHPPAVRVPPAQGTDLHRRRQWLPPGTRDEETAACHRVNKSTSKTLNEADRHSVIKRYRTILTRGRRNCLKSRPDRKENADGLRTRTTSGSVSQDMKSPSCAS